MRANDIIDLFLKYQVNIFIDTTSIIPNPNTISKVLELFKDDGLIPSTIVEIGPSGQIHRLRMSTTDSRWGIVFLSRYINIEHFGEPEPKKDEMDNFLSKAKKYTQKIFQYLGQKSNRLAFIVDLALKEMTEKELKRCYSKFFVPLPSYESNSPFEWKNRSISKEKISLVDTIETMNVITEVRRARELIASKGIFDRVFIQYEINTNPENKETRFSIKQFDTFIDIAKDEYNKIFIELESTLNA